DAGERVEIHSVRFRFLRCVHQRLELRAMQIIGSGKRRRETCLFLRILFAISIDDVNQQGRRSNPWIIGCQRPGAECIGRKIFQEAKDTLKHYSLTDWELLMFETVSQSRQASFSRHPPSS